MKRIFETRRSIFTVIHLALGLAFALHCQAVPTINSVLVNPDPLVQGQAFTVTVSASSDVVQAVATVDFRPWSTSLLRVTLTKQGNEWVGSGLIPANLQNPGNGQATLKVLAFDASRQRAEFTHTIVVSSPPLALITAVFDPNTGILTINGNNLNNNISVLRAQAGNILVNGGAVPIAGGLPTVANTVLIRAFGFDGDDQIRVDEAGGLLPVVNFFGGAGKDLLVGGSTADQLSGGPGADVLEGRGGIDQLFGESGDDTLIGGGGNDLAFGGADNDTFVWNPGDGNDTFEGQAGFDTMLFNGANIAETISLSANGGRLLFFRNIANIVMDVNNLEQVLFNARGGADLITVNDLSGTDVTAITLNLEGVPASGTGDGADDVVTVNGTQGNDTITVTDSPAGVTVAGLAATVTLTGLDPAAADQLFINGLAATDSLLLNGTGAGDSLDIFANGPRVRFFRNNATVLLESDDLERATFNALSGADNVVVGSLLGTDLSDVSLDLAGAPNDGVADNVTVNSSNGDDVVAVADFPGGLRVTGLPGTVTITGADPALDQLTVNALGGDDVVNASGLSAGRIIYTVNGGLGEDIFIGSQGDDLFNGGDGDDTALCGAGNDTFVWNPGDDNDTIEGQDGFDTMLFNGANIAETISLTANGGRVLFLRNIANVVMDLNDVEQVIFTARGGADIITVNDLSGTDLTDINLNLDSLPGSGLGDGAADSVVVNGTLGDDVIVITGSASGVNVSGLSSAISIFGSEAANDRLTINALAGDDVVEASALAADGLQLTANGGSGDDVLIGGDGNDILSGDDGDDVLLGGPGTDVLDGGPGDDIEIQ